MDFKTGLSALSSLVKTTSVAGQGGPGGLTDRLGSFADSLRQGVKSAKIDADVSLGNAFMDAMDGEMGKELASLTEANQLMDSLLGQSGGGSDGLSGLLGGAGALGGLNGLGGQDLFMQLLQAQARQTIGPAETDALDRDRGHQPGGGPGVATAKAAGESGDMAVAMADAVRDTTHIAGRPEAQPAVTNLTQARGAGEQAPLAERMADRLADALVQERGQASGDMAGDAAETVARTDAVAAPSAPVAPAPVAPAAERVDTAMTLDAARRAMAAKVYGQAQERTTLGDLLAARFESGGDPAAIGWDRTGGTSYGMYQIASRTGAFDEFLSYLDGRAPDFAQALRQAGPADTGSRHGAVPEAWKTLAAEHPQRFEDLQHQFIAANHFRPAADKILQMTGVDVRGLGPALSEVLFSTAVQHGATGSANIFARAAERAGAVGDRNFARKWITEIYADRGRQFGSSNGRVRSAVQDRLQDEMRAALQLLSTSAGLDTHA